MVKEQFDSPRAQVSFQISRPTSAVSSSQRQGLDMPKLSPPIQGNPGDPPRSGDVVQTEVAPLLRPKRGENLEKPLVSAQSVSPQLPLEPIRQLPLDAKDSAQDVSVNVAPKVLAPAVNPSRSPEMNVSPASAAPRVVELTIQDARLEATDVVQSSSAVPAQNLGVKRPRTTQPPAIATLKPTLRRPVVAPPFPKPPTHPIVPSLDSAMLATGDVMAGKMPSVTEPVLTSEEAAGADPATPTPLSQPPRRSWLRSSSWMLIWLGTLGLSAGLGAFALFRLFNLPPVPDCQQISPLAADVERLYCARLAAESGSVHDVVAGIALVEEWSPDHPLHGEAEALVEDWSEELLAIAREKIQSSDFLGAVEVASQVPASSPLYEDAQAAIARWQGQWDEGETLMATAQDALKQQDWDLANDQLLALGAIENDYWRRQQADRLTQQILDEQTAWEMLQRARQQARDNDFTRLKQAIALAQDISPDTYTWEQGSADITRWSQILVNHAMYQWQQGRRSEAVAVLEGVPFDPTFGAEIRDLMRYSRALRLAQTDAPYWEPSIAQSWGLMAAVSTAQQIQPDSPFFAQAQADIQSWQAQLEDVMQLHVATLVAGFGQPQTLSLAIQQASQIAPDRPRRLQAQTLIAHWQQEIERIEDQPILNRAYGLASAQTIPGYQAAIEQARQIQLGRALRVEAQTAIAHWRLQIETIEDQPILDQAYSLADSGNLEGAIVEASRIGAGRALYEDAQYMIGQWQAAIRDTAIAQDQPLLNQAYEMASREWYSDAIDLASQISPGRPLYGEAQAAIADWRSAREAIWDEWDEGDEVVPPEPEVVEPDVEPDAAYSDAPEETSNHYEGYYSPNYRR